jgi:hypothetical protein
MQKDTQKEKLNPDLMKGPKQPRTFTDILCTITFLAFWVLGVIIAAQGFIHGDLSNIAQPYDSDGNQCGKSKSFEDFPFLYFNKPFSTNAISETICVKECPAKTGANVQCKPNNDVLSCVSMNVYASKGVAGRFCIPTDLD